MNNISVIGKACTGCRACEQVCVKNCIEVKPDIEGFLYPYVNSHDCVDCGLCLKICSQNKEYEVINTPKKVVAIQNKDEKDIFKSASGGIADIVTKITLENGGVVFGAVYDENLRVHHVAVTDIKDKYKLQSSKYVQSDLEYSYQKAKKLLDEGKQVLFTGTPCQIEGINIFLKRKYDNLITIDLICHGVPSPLFFKKYISSFEKRFNNKVISYDFRSKLKRGWGTTYLVKTKNKTESKPLSVDKYGNNFMAGTCYRECCYNCKYANLSRPADLTVGDFWGVEKFYPNINSSKGISVLLINSQKGEEIFETISKQAYVFDIKLEEVLQKQGNLKHPTRRPIQRDNFYKNINNDDFIENIEFKPDKKEQLKMMLPNKLSKLLKKYI